MAKLPKPPIADDLAKIIAAAPEMLSALLEIVGIYEDSEKNNGLAELLARIASKAISEAITK